MATIEIIGEDDFRRELEQMDEYALIAQVLIQHGSVHALGYLKAKGATPENCAAMLEQIERNCAVADQVAAQRGIDLPIVSDFKPPARSHHERTDIPH